MKAALVTLSTFALMVMAVFIVSANEPRRIAINQNGFILRGEVPGGQVVAREIRFDGERPLDFGPTRLIPGNMGVAFPPAGPQILVGVDEAPTVIVDGKILGGNHSATQYHSTLSDKDDIIQVDERYNVDGATIKISWEFTSDGGTDVAYTISPHRKIHVVMSGFQMQRPLLSEGEDLFLLADGYCLKIPPRTETLVPPDVQPPFEWVTVVGNQEKRRFTLDYYHDDRGSPDESMYISPAGKYYPRAFEGDISEPVTIRAQYGLSWEHAGSPAPECN